MGQVTKENVTDVITYHAPDVDGVNAITRIRAAMDGAIVAILDNCPDCADRTAAIRKIREGMMTANASIALKGLV